MRQIPTKWKGVVGNNRLIRYVKNVVTKIRTVYEKTGTFPSAALLPIFVFGDSRTGKSAVIKLFLRCLVCQRLDAELDPCDGTCPTCCQRPEVLGMTGLFTEVITVEQRLPVHITTIACPDVESRQDLQDRLLRARGLVNGLVVVFMDEAHRLARNFYDESLLMPFDDENILWIVASAKPGGLETMFHNRAIKLKTELPSPRELADWLAAKGEKRKIVYEDKAILRLVEKSNGVPGIALQALAMAELDPNGLTLDLVENDWIAQIE